MCWSSLISKTWLNLLSSHSSLTRFSCELFLFLSFNYCALASSVFTQNSRSVNLSLSSLAPFTLLFAAVGNCLAAGKYTIYNLHGEHSCADVFSSSICGKKITQRCTRRLVQQFGRALAWQISHIRYDIGLDKVSALPRWQGGNLSRKSFPIFFRFFIFLAVHSICVTVVVLNVHFRSPQTHTMNPWIKSFFIEFLPKFLFMKRPKYVFETNRYFVDCCIPPSITPVSFDFFYVSLTFSFPWEYFKLSFSFFWSDNLITFLLLISKYKQKKKEVKIIVKVIKLFRIFIIFLSLLPLSLKHEK